MVEITAFKSNDGNLYLTKEEAIDGDKNFEMKNKINKLLKENEINDDTFSDTLLKLLLNSYEDINSIISNRFDDTEFILYGLVENKDFVYNGTSIITLESLSEIEETQYGDQSIVEYRGKIIK